MEEAFRANLTAGLEVGASCAVVVDGRLVVDLWGGTLDDTTGRAWGPDTLVDCRSATKGLTATCLHVLVDRGLVDLDAPLRRYWPELRVDPTVRQALSHQAGIPIIDDLRPGAILDWDVMASAIERQEPIAPIGAAPARDPGWQPELAGRMYAPVLPPLAPGMNSPAFRSASIPVTGANGTARAFAALYGELARDGGRLVSPAVAHAMGEFEVDGVDAILGVPVGRTPGFELTPPWETDHRPPHAFGCPSGGGVTFADPEARLGFTTALYAAL